MLPNKSTLKIVNQRQGAQTGETLYQTEDGTWWEAVQFKEHGTGDRHGNKTDGHIRENK